MIYKRSYKGKVLQHSIWRKTDDTKEHEQPICISNVIMRPGLAGAYLWSAKPHSGSKTLNHQGRFDKAIINGDRITFFIKRPIIVNGNDLKDNDSPFLVIKFDEGEVSRLLYEDRWFKTQSWFKVVIENLQLSIF